MLAAMTMAKQLPLLMHRPPKTFPGKNSDRDFLPFSGRGTRTLSKKRKCIQEVIPMCNDNQQVYIGQCYHLIVIYTIMRIFFILYPM